MSDMRLYCSECQIGITNPDEEEFEQFNQVDHFEHGGSYLPRDLTEKLIKDGEL